MKYINILFLILLFCASVVNAQNNTSGIQLKRSDSSARLLINGKPFLVLGGELGNSSASSNTYIRPMWPKLQAMHLNTVLTPVYWELMEPKQGRFDFMLVDSAIASARKYKMKLVLLWFGSWKNSMSCYAPAWVKTDQKTYERAVDSKGNGLEILSAFNDKNLAADIKAFRALMKHVREVDGAQQTVIMVQVENEIGMLTEAREYTPSANEAFNRDVPSAFLKHLSEHTSDLVPEIRDAWKSKGNATGGNWEKVFGKSLATDEMFQAWQYAVYANAVAAAGKKEYNIPMFVNAALNYKNVKPGEYPSAGPLPHLMDIWQTAAPSIDMLCPDFYNPYFVHYNDLYVRKKNPLFIPEIRFEPSNAAKVFYAIGHYKAMGFSPFSIESTEMPKAEPIAFSYDILKQLTPVIFDKGNKMDGVLLDSVNNKQVLVFGNYKLTVSHEYSLGWSPKAKQAGWPESGGMIIQTGDDEFIVAGTGIIVECKVANDSGEKAGILMADEGHYENGKWIAGRRMNGDQDHQGRHIRIAVGDWGIQKVKLYRYR